MNFKLTLILAGLLILLAGLVYYFQSGKSKNKSDERVQIWSVEEEKIYHISIRLPRGKKSVIFIKDPDDRWHLEDANRSPVDPKRWGGIVPLLSGPKSKRMTALKAENPEDYGLVDPEMIVSLGIRDLQDPLEIFFGNRTPQGDQYYVKVKNRDPVFILPGNYCQVLMRLALEPPLPVTPLQGTGSHQEKG